MDNKYHGNRRSILASTLDSKEKENPQILGSRDSPIALEAPMSLQGLPLPLGPPVSLETSRVLKEPLTTLETLQILFYLKLGS